MGDLSEHFSRHEFRCHHCSRLLGPGESLLEVLENIREISGRPLQVVSGYRCPTHNDAIGRSKASQHLLGLAADIPQGRASLAQARRAGAIGVGTKGRWVTHVDVRTTGQAHWRY